MKKLEHWHLVQIRSNPGEEAICPQCGNSNAMLRTGQLGDVVFYECRDCHCIVASNAHVAEGSSRVIARDLGMKCIRCRSFNIVDDPANQLKCGDCGEVWL